MDIWCTFHIAVTGYGTRGQIFVWAYIISQIDQILISFTIVFFTVMPTVQISILL